MTFPTQSDPPSPAPRALVRAGRTAPRTLALFLVAAFVGVLSASAPRWLPPLRRALAGPAGEAAQALAARLRTEKPELAPIEVAGREVRLLGGRARLAIRWEPPAGRTPTREVAHLHVTAWLRDVPGGMEACVFGYGSDRATAIVGAVESYRGRVLPAVLPLSSVLTEGEPFGGTEPTGVRGRRGFTGPLASVGDVPSEILHELYGASLFDGATIPDDDRAHLLKAVLLAKDGAWERSLELDGAGTTVSDAPWTGAHVPPQPAVVIRFAAFRGHDQAADAAGRAEAIRRIAAAEAAVLAQGSCPLPRLPARLAGVAYTRDFCRGGRLLDCSQECDAGSGTACYHAALDVQAEPALEPHAQALFLRACRLGVASGCTNAAADIDLRRERAAGTAEACTVPTYERTCAAGDAWGCTMLGDALLVGRGVRADPSRARVALEKACHGDEADPACVAARRLLTRSGAGIDGPP